MHRWPSAIVVSITALFGLCTTVRSQIPAALKGVKKIVCLGDSITQSGERPGGYVWLLRRYLTSMYPEAGIEVRNAGISGNKSTDMLARFQKDVLDCHPDLITISVGVNDVWHGFYDHHDKGDGPLGIPLADYETNVEKMCDLAANNHARVVLLSATLIKEDIHSPENRKAYAYNKALKKIAGARGLRYVDLQAAFRALIGAYRRSTGSTRNFLTVDGVHMNGLGNQLMADCVLNALEVPEPAIASVSAKVLSEISARPAPPAVPPGRIVSVGAPATASSESEGNPASNATAPIGQTAPRPALRWCAKDGSFDPPQWWMVDLGQEVDLTGIRLFFSPEELDTWKYRVEVSQNGTDFIVVADETAASDFFNAKAHLFGNSTRGRYVRVLFTAPTSAMNWASLSNVQVFAK